jgi:hypothetical protein
MQSLKSKVTKEEKVKLGRPPKKVQPDPLPIEGIVKSPSVRGVDVEFLFQGPIVFNKLYGFYKSIGADEIILTFATANVIMSTSHNLITTQAIIDCSQVPRYYNSNIVRYILGRKVTSPVMESIDTSIHNMRITSKAGENKLFIVLSNSREEFVYNNTMLAKEIKHSKVHNWSRESYPLKFSLNKSDLKKIIANATRIDKSIVIQKDHGGDLCFKYNDDTHNVNSEVQFRNASKIQLESDIPEGDIVGTTVDLSRMKTVINALPSDSVRFFVDKDRPLILLCSNSGAQVEIMIEKQKNMA